MLGYVAQATSGELSLQADELEAARWVSRAELLNPQGFFTPPSSSLARHLLLAFARGEI